MSNKQKNPRTDLAKVQGDNLKPFPADTDIETMEFFDQYGVLLSRTPVGIIENTRPQGKELDFFAVYINGELGFFLELNTDNVLFNRIQEISKEKLNLADILSKNN